MLLEIHVVFGTVSLLAGAAALSARKGSRLHTRSGLVFVIAMLVMTITGAAVAASVPERGTALIGIFTAYLVATSWRSVSSRHGERGLVEWLGLGVASLCGVTFVAFSVAALGSPRGTLDSLPASAHYPFAILAFLAASLDLNHLLRRTVSPQQRIARHVWRMCAAFLIAAFSFFIGQQDVMPDYVRGSPLLFGPELLILLAMLYWLVRLRFAKQLRNVPGVASTIGGKLASTGSA